MSIQTLGAPDTHNATQGDGEAGFLESVNSVSDKLIPPSILSIE